MEMIDAMLQRRSIRKFQKTAIPPEKLNAIIQAGLLAPTSRNLRPCRFIVVQDQAVLHQLSAAKPSGAGFVADSSAAIAVFGDSQTSDTWIEDCSIAMTYMMLAAADQGIGSCWCQLHLRSSLTGKSAEETARELLSVPERYRIVGLLALGIPAAEPTPQSLSELNFGKVTFL